MEIKRAGSQPSAKGPSDWFTGSVRIDPLFQAPDPALVIGRQRDLRAGRAYRMAYTSAWTNAHRHCWLWLGAARRRSNGGDSPR